jgi:hypothetical protein
VAAHARRTSWIWFRPPLRSFRVPLRARQFDKLVHLFGVAFFDIEALGDGVLQLEQSGDFVFGEQIDLQVELGAAVGNLR